MSVQGLDWQLVDVRFTQGLDTKTQAKLVIPSKWAKLENVTLTKDGTPQRRDGMAVLAAAATGNGLAQRADELLVVNGSAVSSISIAKTPPIVRTIQDPVFATPAKLGNVMVSKQEVFGVNGMQDSPDCANGNGFTCYVWRDISPYVGLAVLGVSMCLVDESTGTHVYDIQLSASATAACPRVVFSDGYFFLFWMDGATLIKARLINTNVNPPTLGGGAGVNIVNSVNLAAGINIDACAFAHTGGVSAVVTYGWNDGVTSVQGTSIQVVANAPAVSVTTALITEVAAPFATITGMAVNTFSASTFGDAAVFVQSSTTGVVGTVFQYTMAVFAGPTVIDATAAFLGVGTQSHVTAVSPGPGNTGNLVVFTDQQAAWGDAAGGSSGMRPIRCMVVDAALTVSAGPADVQPSATFDVTLAQPAGPQGPFIAGKAFSSVDGKVFLPVWTIENYEGADFVSPAGTRVTINTQNSLFLLELGVIVPAVAILPCQVVAKALYGSVGFAVPGFSRPFVSTPCSTPSVTTGRFRLAQLERTTLSIAGGHNLSATGVVGLTFEPNTTKPPIRCELGETTYFAGGSPTGYDGRHIAEVVFLLAPEGIHAAATAGGALTDGVYQVVVISEATDNAGQVHQSAPSLAVTVTTGGGNNTITVQVPTLMMTQQSNVQFVAYITQNAGLSFNRVATAALPAGTPNDTTVAFVTLGAIDQLPAAYAGNALLYTQPNLGGSTLPNRAPGPMQTLGVHQNRLWFDKSDQPGAFGYSQQYIQNVGLQFNEQLGGLLPVSSGGLVGVASMDEKVILFCARKPFVVYGSGPTPGGGFSNYSEPQEVSSDVGCVEARSILKMPNGIIFKSVKGFYLLGRDLSVRYIGEGVEAFNANDVTSAVLLEDRQECRWSSDEVVFRTVGVTLGQATQINYTGGSATVPALGALIRGVTSGQGGFLALQTGGVPTGTMYLNGPPTGAFTNGETIRDSVSGWTGTYVALPIRTEVILFGPGASIAAGAPVADIGSGAIARVTSVTNVNGTLIASLEDIDTPGAPVVPPPYFVAGHSIITLTCTQLVYSYAADGGEWSTSQLNAGNTAVVDAMWWPTVNAYVSLSADEGVSKDVPGQIYDLTGIATVGTAIATLMRTAWLKLQSLNGFQRCRWLYLSGVGNGVPINSTLSWAVDFDDAYDGVSPGAYTASVNLSTMSLVAGQSIDIRHKLRRQKMKSVAFTFGDDGNDYTLTEGGLRIWGSSMTGLQSLTLQVGLKRGTNKLRAAQAVG